MNRLLKGINTRSMLRIKPQTIDIHPFDPSQKRPVAVRQTAKWNLQTTARKHKVLVASAALKHKVPLPQSTIDQINHLLPATAVSFVPGKPCGIH